MQKVSAPTQAPVIKLKLFITTETQGSDKGLPCRTSRDKGSSTWLFLSSYPPLNPPPTHPPPPPREYAFFDGQVEEWIPFMEMYPYFYPAAQGKVMTTCPFPLLLSYFLHGFSPGSLGQGQEQTNWPDNREDDQQFHFSLKHLH